MKIFILIIGFITFFASNHVRGETFSSVEDQINDIDDRDSDSEAIDSVAEIRIDDEVKKSKTFSDKRAKAMLSQVDAALENVEDNPDYGDSTGELDEEIHHLKTQTVKTKKAKVFRKVSKKEKPLKSSSLNQKMKTKGKTALKIAKAVAPKNKAQAKVAQKRQIALATVLPKKKVR